MIIIGKYNIENYDVIIEGVLETRQRITYYDLENNEITRYRYEGDSDSILDGYVDLNGCPPRVTRWQFRSQLSLMPSTDPGYDNLADYITYLISQMTGDQKIITQNAWESANTISRYSPAVLNFGQMLNLTSSEIDDIFINAETIEA